jgi:hypothetical protein
MWCLGRQVLSAHRFSNKQECHWIHHRRNLSRKCRYLRVLYLKLQKKYSHFEELPEHHFSSKLPWFLRYFRKFQQCKHLYRKTQWNLLQRTGEES